MSLCGQEKKNMKFECVGPYMSKASIAIKQQCVVKIL